MSKVAEYYMAEAYETDYQEPVDEPMQEEGYWPVVWRGEEAA